MNYKKPAVITMFIVFIVLSVVLVFFFAACIPFLMQFEAGIYSAGNTILTSSATQTYINSINDTTVRAQIQGSFDKAQGSTQTNISVLGTFYQYSWIIIIIITALILFMMSRMLVETQGSGVF